MVFTVALRFLYLQLFNCYLCRALILLDYNYIYIPEVMKTGSANLNFLCNFSRLSLSNISLFTVLFTAYVGFFRFFSLLSGKGYVFKWMYNSMPFVRGGILNGRSL